MKLLCAMACILVICQANVIGDEKDVQNEVERLLAEGNQAYGKGKYQIAIKALDKAIKLDSKNATAYQSRGTCYFMLSQFKESVADYDRFLELEPKKFNDHWQRGIALYYLGKYEEGRKQFEGHLKVNPADVENSVWHMMCVTRKENLAAARKVMLPCGKDTRVPMMEVYDLFKGTKKPEDVMKAAMAGDLSENERKPNLFYAHLYLGIYHDLKGEKTKAIEHLKQASGKYKIGYMGEVARIHLSELQKAK